MRSTGRATAHRAFLMNARGSVTSVNDNTMSQQGDHGVLSGESHSGAERLQNYGHTSVPLGPNDGQGGGGIHDTGDSGDGDPRSSMGWSAESHISYGSGNKSHPTVTHVEDRRHRPRGLKPGEHFSYDDQGQGGYAKRTGYYNMAAGEKNQASLRHVKKEKQPMANSGGGGSGGAGSAGGSGGSGGGQQQEYKHEGEATAEFAAEMGKCFGVANDAIQHAVSKMTTLVDKDHVAIKANDKENVVWTDKKGNWTTKPLEVQKYPYKAPTRSATDANSGGGSGGG